MPWSHTLRGPVDGTRTASLEKRNQVHSHPKRWLERGSLLPAQPRKAEDDDSKVSRPAGTDHSVGAGPAPDPGRPLPAVGPGHKG